jgi:chromosome segregation ATPase
MARELTAKADPEKRIDKMKEQRSDAPKPNLDKFHLIETQFNQLKNSCESITFEIQDTDREIAQLQAQRDLKPEELEQLRAGLTEKRAQLKAGYETASKRLNEALALLYNCKQFLKSIEVEQP